jgi:putative tricarboxylic transport membrane protein
MVKRFGPQNMVLVGWLLLAAVFCVGSVNLGIGSPHRPLPGFMPFLIGLFMGGVTLFTLAHGLWTSQGATGEEKERIGSWGQLKKPAMILAALIAYGLAMDHLGFLASTFLLMLFLFKGIEPQKWWVAVLLALVTVGFSHLIFVVWLGCQFPTFWR